MRTLHIESSLLYKTSYTSNSCNEVAQRWHKWRFLKQNENFEINWKSKCKIPRIKQYRFLVSKYSYGSNISFENEAKLFQKTNLTKVNAHKRIMWDSWIREKMMNDIEACMCLRYSSKIEKSILLKNERWFIIRKKPMTEFFQLNKLYECPRRKPGWRFTAGL